MEKNKGKYFTVPTELFLSKDGDWFHEGVQITHERIIEQLNKSMIRDGADYFVNIGYERCKVIVEDAPYFVKSVGAEEESIMLLLSDGTEEEFDSSGFQFGENGVPYALVKKTKCRAKFTRAAYYQLTEFLIEAPDGTPVFKIGDRLLPLKKATIK